MASTYTSNIRLTKQGDGDNPNTWGTVLNDQVISLVDDAIASYTTVSIGSAATVTLYRQKKYGNWTSPFKNIKQDLEMRYK